MPCAVRFDDVHQRRAGADKVHSDLVHCAQAYRLIRIVDDAKPTRLLGRGADLYNLADNRFGYLLPYFAFASSRAGGTIAVEESLGTFDPKQQFDIHLADVFLAGTGDRVADADKHLTLADYRRPLAEVRPLLREYPYTEICRLLYGTIWRDAYRRRRPA